ncbi:DUF115 domain-containing protein [Eubacterium sp. MSJ-13]|uniref:motility associated factor glycosyltransferase family protein n=1 Tax=Eubacterium sp. MSJ-13 TaxID=2841513 RepID=UPI001C10D4B8|nr:6-hydroxymethylpterin diphosphokinase MptE-like protein [Eubacterium sp. MSJ-13]MBU5477773.1 DUF115 domain-containing protein [Eubacterium sp. MSJ-13]
MQNLIKYVNDMIYDATKISYYAKEGIYQEAYDFSNIFIKKVEKYFEIAESIQFSDSIELLHPLYDRLKDCIVSLCNDEEQKELNDLQKICGREFVKKLSEIEICLLENNEWQLYDYFEKNMQILAEISNPDSRYLYSQLKAAEEHTAEKYELSYTATGNLSLAVCSESDTKINICSSGNPWQEALMYCRAFKNQSAKDNDIIIIGFGMGYHIQCMADMYPQSSITVLEGDIGQLRIAFNYRDLSGPLSNNNIHIVYCKTVGDYAEQLKKVEISEQDPTEKNTILKVWKPSVRSILDKKLRDVIENYQLISDSIEKQGKLLDENFSKNISLHDETVDKIKGDIYEKNVIIIAGGPSLDDNIELLRKICNDMLYKSIRKSVRIICVGKVSKKIIAEGIMPDYIIITDAKPSTQWQLRDIKADDVPLIYISTAAANVVADYKSKRYIAYQSGVKQAEEMAKRSGTILYESGGSVTTLAIDIAIRLGAKRIVCIGTDMGYRGENTHSSGVGGQISNKNILREVEAVRGGRIFTSKTLDIYRRWIEKRIEKEVGVDFVNSSMGAKIRGMRDIYFSEVIKQIERENTDGKEI